MTLAWRMDDDGVVVVYDTLSDGREADIADFWIQPLIDNFGMSRELATEWQKQYCEVLVMSYNKIFTRTGASA